MSSVEDEYFARIERVLGIRTPQPGENRVVTLSVPEWTSRTEAEQLLALVRSRKEKMAGLSAEVGEAERRYLRPIFGNQWKATQCRAVLMTLLQINTALANQEMTLIEWLRSDEQETAAKQVCKQCGAEVASSARFCSQCGSGVKKTSEASPLTSVPSEPRMGSHASGRKLKKTVPGQSAKQIVLHATPYSEGPMYTGSGTWVDTLRQCRT